MEDAKSRKGALGAGLLGLCFVLAACGGTRTGSEVERAALTIETTLSAPVPVETTMPAAVTSTTAVPNVTEVRFPEGTGGAPCGGTTTTVRLSGDLSYRFGLFVPPFSLTATTDNWEVRGYDAGSVRLRWRGESGFRPGTLVVSIFGLSDVGPEETWTQLESLIQSELDDVGETLAWIDHGTGTVGSSEVEWRELRTTGAKPIQIDSAPCVVDLPGDESIWFDSTGRFYVVPLGDITVSILATEQLCDCNLGGLLGTFDQDNELHDWLTVLEDLLSTIQFET